MVAPPPNREPTLKQLEAFESELTSWAQGRWSDVRWKWDAEADKVVVWITTDPQANEHAVRAYCETLWNLAKKHVRGVPFEGVIKRRGLVVNVCKRKRDEF